MQFFTQKHILPKEDCFHVSQVAQKSSNTRGTKKVQKKKATGKQDLLLRAGDFERVLIVHSWTFRTVFREEVTSAPKLGRAKKESASQAGRIILKPHM